MASAPSSPASGRKINPRKVVDRLYLRDLRDLTLHGGVDAQGDLVLVPIFCGLGSKGINASQYLEQSEVFWRDGSLAKCLQQISWTLTERSNYRIYYPSLTVALPLPSPAVIDHVLASPESEASTVKVARSQLQRCVKVNQWRYFKVFAQKLPDADLAAQIFLSAEEQWPGLLSDSFRQQLEAWQDFRKALEDAENKGQFAALPGSELAFAANLAERYRRPLHHSMDASSWSQFFSDRQTYESNIQAYLAQEQSGLGESTTWYELVKKLPSEYWGVVADVGAGICLDLVRRFEAARGYGGIWAEGVVIERGWSGGAYFWQYAHQVGRSRSFKAINSLAFVWRQLIARAWQKASYQSKDWTRQQRDMAAARRYLPESAVATLVEHLPSRPIAEGGILLVRHANKQTAVADDAEAQTQVMLGDVVVEPAVPKPQFAALRTTARAKKLVAQGEAYLTLEASYRQFESIDASAVTSLEIDSRSQLIWPNGRLWQTVDLVKTLVARPDLLLCPEVLTTGKLHFSGSHWDQLALQPGHLPELPQQANSSWTHVHDYFFGVMPWLTCPVPSRKRAYYNDPTSARWPLQLLDGGLQVADVQLAVRFVPVNGSFTDQAEAERLLLEFEHLNEQQVATRASIDQLISAVSENLRFEARPYFEVSGQAIEEVDWFKAVKTKSGNYRLRNGQMINASVYDAKTEQFILRKRVYAKFRSLGLAEIWRTQMQVLATVKGQVSPDEYMRQLSLRIAPVLKDLDRRALGSLSESLLAVDHADLKAVLRPYQAAGVAWGYFRLKLGFGVCLADEMGLGKTLQAIAILRCLHSHEKPSLVVMPKTLLHNWQRELQRFAPNLKVGIYGEGQAYTQSDVLLVTYPRLRLDQEQLASQQWNLVILDEAQAIKNAETQVAEAALQLNAAYRLALSGTPIENRAAELWSIVNWLNPGYLGQQVDFNNYTAMARSSEQKIAMLAPLRECLHPLILRRRKSDPAVALGLPDKVHLELTCELSEEQSFLYESVIETVMAEDEKDLKPIWRRAVYLKAIMHLKQICIHPDLFYGEQDDEDVVATIDAPSNAESRKIRAKVLSRLQARRQTAGFANWIARSGKLMALNDLVESLTIQSRGILIFTQYLAAADILRRLLSHIVVDPIPLIHGGLSSRERLAVVDEFNERCHQRHSQERCPILILSIKAGGTGLNLTGADRVIHFDRWWNPAVEDQATDRAHRFGQDRTVFIHTITSEASIEESIARLFVEKRRLAEDLLGAATANDVGDFLRDQVAFLDLIDPQRIFSQRLTKVAGKRRSRS